MAVFTHFGLFGAFYFVRVRKKMSAFSNSDEVHLVWSCTVLLLSILSRAQPQT